MVLHSLLIPARRIGAVLTAAGFLLAAPVSVLAQSQEAAQLAVRIQQLEEQMRNLTGQVEGLQFQLTQMQTLLENMTADNEFRFQQLEGNAGGAIAPAPTTTDPAITAAPAETAALPDPAPLDLSGAPMDSGDGGSFDALGDSSDPLVGTNSGGVGTIGTLDGSRPLNLSLDGGVEISSGDATAQYNAGYEAIVRGDYAFAEDQFQQFIALYPDDPNAADATNWLGEALMQRGAYDDAALVLAEGYQKYQSSPRAPDLMLKLGIALVGAGEVEVACRTFFTLERRHADLDPAFLQRLGQEKARAQCPV